MINLVSMGMSCQTTHQLNHFCEKHPQKAAFIKGPFDWLICPPSSAANWLADDLRDFTSNDLTENQGHAYWPQFKLWFWHGFMDRSGERPTLDLEGQSDHELSKLNHLRNRFRSLELSTTVFVVSNTQNNLNTEVFKSHETDQFQFTEHNIDQLRSALKKYFDSTVNLAVITREDRATPELLKRVGIHKLPLETSNWKGDKIAWSNVLGSSNLFLN